MEISNNETAKICTTRMLNNRPTMSLHSESHHNMPTPQQDEDEEFPKRWLATAHRLLRQVDDAYIIRKRGHDQRLMPTFSMDELDLGQMLGKGGFGIVYEIRKFRLHEEENNGTKTTASTATTITTTAEEDGLLQGPDNPQQGKEQDEEEDQPAEQSPRHYKILNQPEDESSSHVHYDVTKARHMMEKRCIRRGNTRYALKRLQKGTLSTKERARGMVDLALEAKYLSVVWHPNIIKLRGVATGDTIGPGFFIILDRLEETLDQRMLEWAKQEKKFRGKLFGRGRNKKALKELMLSRMTCAYDLSAAFMYLHENRLVYRDIKPENIGFDVRGDVKVFDFGLCKSLSPELKSLSSYGYRLTGRAGSFPYMAPEVVRCETYDTKCDVFSFAILLWEILSLKQAFKSMSQTQFVDKVVLEHQRPPVSKEWPALTRLMMPEAWDKDPGKRPDMKRVAILIRGDLNDMSNDEQVLHRTEHMRERSSHSITEFSERDQEDSERSHRGRQ